MQFNTWYDLICETEKEWHDDFARIKDAGFDHVVLWKLQQAAFGSYAEGDISMGGDGRAIVADAAHTQRALSAARRAGLKVSLGIWHPLNMGDMPPEHRIKLSSGKVLNGPDIFNEDWLLKEWRPYVKAVAEHFAGHEAYQGIYFDDTFFSIPMLGPHYLGYSDADRKRFQTWLKERYLTPLNLTKRHKLDRYGLPTYTSFEEISPPSKPEEGLALWGDWMRARADWCEDWARITNDVYRSVDRDPNHSVVLSCQDYHVHCNVPQYGVDYRRLMDHFDRFEIYMAADHRGIGRAALLKDASNDVRLGLEIAGRKPFQFLTWFSDPIEYSSMGASALEAVLSKAIEEGAQAIGVYAYKVPDWRAKNEAKEHRACFKQVSLKYNPEMLESVNRFIRKASSWVD